MIPLDKLLEPISPDNSCGEDLGYNQALSELRTEVKGKPESQVGDEVIEAKEGDWRKIKEQSIALLERSKNLEIAIYLCVAALETEGLPGFRDGMVFLHKTIQEFWDDLYPKLDPEEPEGERYIERVNLLENLARPFKTFEDPLKVVERLRKIPLSDSSEVGQFSLGRILATKEGAESAPSLALIQGSFQKTEPEILQATAQAVSESEEALLGIETFLNETIGLPNSPTLDNLKEELQQIVQVLQEFSPGGETFVPGEEAATVGTSAGAGPAAPKLTGEITSREDVNRALDKIIDYYTRNEPTSPLPFLMQRAKRLVNSNFLDIVKNFTPDSEQEFKKILDIIE